MLQKIYFSFLLILFSHLKTIAQTNVAQERWVDSIYNSMPDTARIAQLMIIRAHSNLGADHIAKVEDQIKRYQVGGLCFFQGTPEKQAELTNRYQAISKVPLFVSMDAEWGLSMRLKETAIAWPKQMMLGAIQDNSLIYKFGAAVAKECKRIGVQINYAPDADVNNNPKNPVINERSFGEDKLNVATKAFMYMKGMQDNGVMACAKHFPGHGDTDVDSHLDLPVISYDTTRLNNIELMPFRVLSQFGIGSMMVAHLEIPALDNRINTPMTISRPAVTDLLRKKLGYNGLIFTDGLEMKGLAKYYTSAESSARCIQAGNDMLCLPEDVPGSIAKILEWTKSGDIDSNQVQASVKRILRAKYQYGLTKTPSIDLFNLRDDINGIESKTLKRELIKNALTVVRSHEKLIPFKTYQPDSIATLGFGADSWTPFQYMLNNYGLFNQLNASKNLDSTKKAFLVDYLIKKKIVIISLHDMKPNAKDNFGLTPLEIDLVNEVAQKTQVVLVVFGNPYALKSFDGVQNVLECYNEDKTTQEIAAEGLFGLFEFKGKLPVTASDKAQRGMGLNTTKVKNILDWNTDVPEMAGVNSKILNKIDSIVDDLIYQHAAPGCQVLVAKDGQVVYNKAFGDYTYLKNFHPVELSNMYDLASITKCMATTVSLMKLYEEGKFSLTSKYDDYLPYIQRSNKANMLMKDVLVHQAGLLAWIPFYKETMDSIKDEGAWQKYPSPKYYLAEPKENYTVRVAKNLWMREDYMDTLKMRIVKSNLRENRNYVYSDLGLILLTDVVKSITGKSLDVYAHDNFYAPLKMNHTLFNPMTRYSESDCAPTDRDNYFRMQQTQGYVHDMAAAMLGGVSGHAGLFSNTSDLVILSQMLLNEGNYGGVQYFKPETVKYFAQRHEGSSRRGYGWDMKDLNPAHTPNMSTAASNETYGHTGFTGNALYIDPTNKLIYIFLSNRTYPEMDNNILTEKGYRSKIQTLIYDAIVK